MLSSTLVLGYFPHRNKTAEAPAGLTLPWSINRGPIFKQIMHERSVMYIFIYIFTHLYMYLFPTARHNHMYTPQKVTMLEYISTYVQHLSLSLSLIPVLLQWDREKYFCVRGQWDDQEKTTHTCFPAFNAFHTPSS